MVWTLLFANEIEEIKFMVETALTARCSVVFRSLALKCLFRSSSDVFMYETSLDLPPHVERQHFKARVRNLEVAIKDILQI